MLEAVADAVSEAGFVVALIMLVPTTKVVSVL